MCLYGLQMLCCTHNLSKSSFTFPSRCIGPGGPNPWPPGRYTLGHFLRYVKARVDTENIQNFEKLERRIRELIESIIRAWTKIHGVKLNDGVLVEINYS